MLSKIKTIFGIKPAVSRSDQVPDLPNQPITHALLLRAAHLTDETEQDLRKMVGKIAPIPELATLESKVSSAFSVVALDLVMQAQKIATGKTVYLPPGPLPLEAHAIVAFGLFVSATMGGALKDEGHNWNSREASAALVNNMFMPFTVEDRVEILQQAAGLYVEIARDTAPNTREWIDTLGKLVLGYIMQFTTNEPALKQVQFAPLFASQLSTFLSATKLVDR